MSGYRTKTQILALGGVDTVIRSLLDRQQFADPTGSAERVGISSTSWPLFGQVWPSSLVLADHVQALPLGSLRILEVGCGLALASLVVHRRRGCVTASDRHPLTEGFLSENLRLNAMAPMPYWPGDWARSQPGLGRFDLIMGSDVLYEPDLPGLLAEFIAQHAMPRAQVVIVDPDRGNRSAFHRAMQALGFERSETRIVALPGGLIPYKGRLLQYRREPGGRQRDGRA